MTAQVHRSAPLAGIGLMSLGMFLFCVNDATAFGHRDRKLMVNVAAMYVDEAERDTHQAWADGLAESLGKNGGGGYVGFLGEEDEETLRAAYPNGNWERLRGLKRRYDPDNLFHLNHNIPPADS